MTDGAAGERLVTRLMAAAKVTPEERAGITTMARRGVFDDPAFVSRAVRTAEPPYVMWRAAREWAQDAKDGELLEVAEGAIRALGYDETDPPLDAERLQVVLDLDEPKGWVVARWRDIYADHGQSFETDLAVEWMTDHHLCWSCGDLGVTERDDLWWCAMCLAQEGEAP